MSVQVLAEQGLGKFVDEEFVRTTSKEMQEAMDMSREEFDLAAHKLLQQTTQQKQPITMTIQQEIEKLEKDTDTLPPMAKRMRSPIA